MVISHRELFRGRRRHPKYEKIREILKTLNAFCVQKNQKILGTAKVSEDDPGISEEAEGVQNVEKIRNFSGSLKRKYREIFGRKNFYITSKRYPTLSLKPMILNLYKHTNLMKFCEKFDAFSIAKYSNHNITSCIFDCFEACGIFERHWNHFVKQLRGWNVSSF